MCGLSGSVLTPLGALRAQAPSPALDQAWLWLPWVGQHSFPPGAVGITHSLRINLCILSSGMHVQSHGIYIYHNEIYLHMHLYQLYI